MKILGSKKREDDLYDDLIEDLGIKNDKNIFIHTSVCGYEILISLAPFSYTGFRDVIQNRDADRLCMSSILDQILFIGDLRAYPL